MDGDHFERISQKGKCKEIGKCSILESSSEIARSVLEEVKALAGTTTCKSVQLVRLKQWA